MSMYFKEMEDTMSPLSYSHRGIIGFKYLNRMLEEFGGKLWINCHLISF